MRTYRQIRFRPVRNRNRPPAPVVIDQATVRMLEQYQRKEARPKMAALDKLPQNLRQAVTAANYSCWDPRLLAGQLQDYPSSGLTHLGKILADAVRKDDEQLRRQRQRY
jgi:hypothetical protein